jgi:hypothetical protein
VFVVMLRLILVVAAVAPFAGSCSLGFVAPQQVGAGVGRLSVVNASALVALVSADVSCGFASENARTAAVLEGDVGARGTWTVSIDDCVLDFPEGVVVSTTCDGERLRASGRATVSGSLSVEGILTGNADAPVAPTDPDTTRLQLSAQLADFHVEVDNSDNALTIGDGTMLVDARPRLAALYDNPGICGWTTPNITFDQVALADARVTVASEDLAAFNVSVSSMSVIAQLGVGPDGDANTFEGAIEVDGRRVTLPEPGDEGLDPEFDQAEWEASYAACVDESTPNRPLLPVTFECPGIDRLLAVGAGQRVVEDMLMLSRLMQTDSTCGFGSLLASENVEFIGDVVGEEASRQRRVEGCQLTFAEPTAIRRNCGAPVIEVQGRVTIDAVEIVTGVKSDNLSRPIFPSGDGLKIALTATFDDFVVTHEARDAHLRYRSGAISADVQPRLALSEDGHCEIVTPVARLTVDTTTADTQLVTDALTADVALGPSHIEAVNGRWGEETNALRGDVEVNGAVYSLGAGVDGSLVSLYDQAAFDATWQCQPGLAEPISFDCPVPDAP